MSNLESYRPIRLRTHLPCGCAGDRLGYEDYAKTIASLLSGLTQANAGLTVGIFGDWGSGKSSLLRMVQETLEKRNKDRKRFLLVRFDAWRYIHQEQIWLAMLRRIHRTLEEGKEHRRSLSVNRALWMTRLYGRPNFDSALWKFFWRGLVLILCGSLLIWGIASILGLSQQVTGSVATVTGSVTVGLVIVSYIFQAASALLQNRFGLNLPSLIREPFDQGQALLMDNFREDFRSMVRDLAKERLVVVLIDDLDRCPAQQIVPVLEAIKHFGLDDAEQNTTSADTAQIVFILAADRRAIESAVANYYGQNAKGSRSSEARRLAREYVEKIVQIPFELPRLTRQQLGRLLFQE